MKAVIFDLDGVVVYTDAYHYRAWKQLSDEMGWAFDETLNDQLRGVSRLASLQIILDHNSIEISEEDKERYAAIKNGYYKDLLTMIDESALVPGAVEFVRALRDRGLKTGLGSSSRNASTVLEKLEITSLFDAVITGNDITRSKPDPQIFLLVAEKLGLAPADCVVFEDAASGVEAANNGGFFSVGFGSTPGLDAADLLVPGYGAVDPERFVS